MNKHKAVVVIPVYKIELSRTERLSLARCMEVLGGFPIVLVGPDSLDYRRYISLSGRVGVEKFSDQYFTSLQSYSELMLSEGFYERFGAYEYMLVYQLDAFVFADQLDSWCAKGYDYIGAPWRDETAGVWTGVGNGGFSLRRVAACLDVLQSNRPEDPAVYWEFTKKRNLSSLGLVLRYPRMLLKYLSWHGNAQTFVKQFINNGNAEDTFWGFYASMFEPSFHIAPVEEAILFSVEAGLAEVYQYYAAATPFGCHREWYLEALYNYANSSRDPACDFERMVWSLARLAPLSRNHRRQMTHT